MKNILLVLLTALAFNANSSSSVISLLPGGIIKFGIGPITTFCQHVDEYLDGTPNIRFTYAATTTSYGSCPGIDSTEFTDAYSYFFDPDQYPPKHQNPGSNKCFDDLMPFNPDI